MPLTVVILTLNEELHIARALTSVASIAEKCVIVDSGSTDRTVEIAQGMGAQVLTNPFVTQAQQFNWVLDQLPSETDWILRLDADEIVSEALALEIAAKLDGVPGHIHGMRLSRRMNFLGQPVRRGGVFPIRLVRLLRHNHGRSEDRWMDEHIIVDGEVGDFSGEIVDDNLNSLTWWTHKHNNYASREVVEMLNLEHGFMARGEGGDADHAGGTGAKRWIKENLYARLPGGLRALAYFLYRYVVRLGFLDTREGQMFHVLQGFWYRYLVDAKLREVQTYMKDNDTDAVAAIMEVTGIDVRP